MSMGHLLILILSMLFSTVTPTGQGHNSSRSAQAPSGPVSSGKADTVEAVRVPFEGHIWFEARDLLDEEKVPQRIRLTANQQRVMVNSNYRYRVFGGDRKSTRLNSSHVANSYAVFCLK